MPWGIRKVGLTTQFALLPVVATATVAAAGSDEATAAPLTATLNRVTCDDPTKGVRLPSIPKEGALLAIVQLGPQSVKLYAAAGQKVEGNSGAYVLGAGRYLLCAHQSDDWKILTSYVD